MQHPPLEDILRDTQATKAHVERCASCRELLRLAVKLPAGPRPEPSGFPAAVADAERYTDWRELADGGMGRTFRVHDRWLGRDVVIKQPLSRDVTPGLDLRARFEHEALLTARLQHPGIVGVYEAGRLPGGEPFYAMPHIRGAPLSDEIERRGTLEARLALLPHITSVCEAVAYAHEQGVVHRDIKPANILVGPFGETILIDWGLAKDLRSRVAAAEVSPADAPAGLTQMGVGTPQYMAPEQALAAAPDPRMDVYALGATLYHTLAGTPPYGTGETAAVRAQLLRHAPTPLDEVAPEIAPALCDIVARAMAREPNARFQTARELCDELHRFQTGRLVQSRRYSPSELLLHWARRHRGAVTVAIVAAVALVGVGLASLVRIARAQRQAWLNERRSQTELRRAMGASASRLSTQPTHRLEALALGVGAVAPALAADEPPAPEALQGLYDAIASGRPAVVLDGASPAIAALAFSPDGTRLATASPDEHSVQLWDARTGRLLGALAMGGAHFSAQEVRFSPTGDRVLSFGREPAQAQLFSTDGRAALTLETHGTLAGAEFLSDGTIVLAAEAIVYLDAQGREHHRVALEAPARALAVCGQRVAVATAAGEVKLLDAHGREQLGFRAPEAFALALDERRVAAVSAHNLVVREVATGQTWELRVGGSGVQLLPDGRSVVVADGATATRVDVVSHEQVTVAAGPIRSAPGGVWTAESGRVRLLDLSDLNPLRELEAPGGLSARALEIGGPRLAVATESAAWILDGRAVENGVLSGHTREVKAIEELDGLVTAGLDGRVIRWADGAVRSLDAEVLFLRAAGGRLLVAGLDGTVRVLDPEPQVLAPKGLPITALAASSDGARVAAARIDGTLFVAGGPVLLPPGSPAVSAAVFSPDGALLAAGQADGTVRLWDAVRGMRVAELRLDSADWPGHSVFTLAFAGPSRVLAARSSDDQTQLLSVPELAEQPALAGHLLAASSDGRRAVTVDAAHDLMVYDLPSTVVARVPFQRPVVTAAFSTDGRRVAAGDVDGTVRVLAGGAPLALAASNLGAVSALRFTADGRTLVVGHSTGALREYPMRVEDVLARACATLALFGRDCR